MCPMSPELAHQLTALDPAVLGARIKAARVAAGLTQPELAGQEASVAYVSRIESGQRRPGTELLEALAAKLGVTLEYLAHGEGWQDASRLELQLDHAELSLAGGEGDNALALAREALGSPGLQAVPGGVDSRPLPRGEALNRLGDPAAVPAFQAAAGRRDRLGHPAQGRHFAVSIWREAGQFERAIAVRTDPARPARRDALGTEEGIRLAVTLAAALFFSGRTEEAAELCDRAITESERLSSPVARASAYWNASYFRSESGDVAGALPLAKRALHLLENTERMRDVGSLRTQLSAIMLRTDPPRLEEAREQLRLADLELEWSQANPGERARNQLVNAQALLLDGDADGARDRPWRGRGLRRGAATDRCGRHDPARADRLDERRARGRPAVVPPRHRDAHRGRRRPRGRAGVVRDRHPGRRRPGSSPSPPTRSSGPRPRPASPRASRSSPALRRRVRRPLTPAGRLPVSTPLPRPRRGPRPARAAGRLPVINTPPVSSPRTTPAQSPSSRRSEHSVPARMVLRCGIIDVA